MKSYIFPATIEQAGDVWQASVPSLKITAQGYSWKDALRNLQDVTQVAVEDALKAGAALPADAQALDHYTAVVNIRGHESQR
ncbi:MAG: type II toxin-antitoxin system HicB family antitoxin [Candidatus Liptonbacteria bacterium]|nr:type II toxin-antitoxin system HicB family antitoxin [Candidatus Liptonbacteria bacterium]